ncbi:unnamed protein product [Urochloa humidicola]
MAEAAVGVLIGKLGVALTKVAVAYSSSLLCKEASALKGLIGEIRKAKGELELMKAYLHDAEKFKDTNETTGIFVKKIRDSAFRIEDVIDEFMYKLEYDKHGGFWGKVKKRIQHVKVWHRLALELHNINSDLEDDAKKRGLYALPVMESSDHHAGFTNQTSCFTREEDLVGIEGNAAKLKGWLVNDLEERNSKITTVWGMGGVGKTTLVDHVYKVVKVHFDASAWVTVSKSYQADDLIKKIAKEFGISTDSSNMDMRKVVAVIRNHLEGKRFILVLDDIWEQDLCINNIMEVFPTNCISRFVLTSRNFGVASLASSNCTIKLKPLGENNSWKLFCKVAFRNNDEKRCPSELQDLAAKFLHKCQGLPIAIACIGRLLSFRTLAYPVWETVYKELESHSNNAIQSVDTILKVSFEDLPYELKNCFLHCAIFPEDYQMTRRRLIRHWITSGFIKEKENKTLEQVAEGYLSDLVNRSLLQVVKKNESGRVKYCRMHDVIRHLAIDKAAKECFGIVYEGHETFRAHGTRRISIQSTNIALSNQFGAPNLRAVYFFTCSVDIGFLRPILASSTLLSTLDLQGTEIKILPNEVFSMFNLRFLGLRDTKIEILPEAIGRLQNLEVLDTAHTYLLSLPKNVAKLIKLRYLYATVEVTEGCFIRRRGVKVPRGIRNLIGLHVLQNVKASSETLFDVAALTELRKLGVDDVTSEHSKSLHSALMNMSNLVSLVIKTSNENEVLPLKELCLPETLSKLGLTGQLEKKRMPRILSSWLHLKNLTRLYLTFSKLDEKSFPNLMVLQNLCFLALFKAYDGKTLCFSEQSFPRLRELHISGAPKLNQFEIEKDALGSLVTLWFSACPELKRLPYGIEYLTSLDELYMRNAADDFIDMLRQEGESNECNEELTKISHIRKVLIVSTEKNFWRRIVSRKGNESSG